MSASNNFLNELNQVNSELKQERIQSFLSVIQDYYSIKCQAENLERVKKHIDQIYNSKTNNLSVRDFLLEEFYLTIYEKYVLGYKMSMDDLKAARIDYEDILESEFDILNRFQVRNTVTQKKTSLIQELEKVCKRFDEQYPVKNGDCNVIYLDYFSKLHQYMEIFKENKSLRMQSVETALEETISEEGIEHLRQAIYCPEGMEMLYIQPIQSMFVTNVDGTCSCTKNTSKAKFKKERTSATLLDKKLQIQTILVQVQPFYNEYNRIQNMIKNIEEELTED